MAILTATGDVFCSGLSISEQAAATGQAPGHQVVRDFMARHPGLLQGRVGTPFGKDIWKPVIGGFNGQASAGGFLLAVHCDLRVASEDAAFDIPEVKVGRGAPWVMPLLGSLPLPVLLEINVTGELMSARRLYEVGFINRLVARDQVLPTAMKLAETLRDNAPLSVQAAKEAMYRTLQTLHNAGLDVATRVWSPVYDSEDAMEGLRAHAEHRKPVWKGR